MYDAPGVRREAVASVAIESGTPCVEDNIVGWAAKTEQLDRFVRPTDAEATEIAVGEHFTQFVGGTHELELSGGLSGVTVDDLLYIDPSDNSVGVSPGEGDVHEVQHVTVDATSGGYTLAMEGEVTAAIAFNATAATFRQALEGLPNIEPGDVTVSGGPGASGGGTPYVVTFVAGQYSDENAPQLVAADVDLAGGGDSVTVTTATAGVAGAGALPLGVVEKIDDSRTPDVARVNTNAWQAFAA
jgi:hypothetical protein